MSFLVDFQGYISKIFGVLDFYFYYLVFFSNLGIGCYWIDRDSVVFLGILLFVYVVFGQQSDCFCFVIFFFVCYNL